MNVHTQAQTKSAPSVTYVQSGLLQRKCARDGAPGLTGQPVDPASHVYVASRFSHNFERVKVHPTSERLQPKLVINPPDDQYEQEADRIATQVVSRHLLQAVTTHPVIVRGLTSVQRLAGHLSPGEEDAVVVEETEQEETPVQRLAQANFVDGNDLSTSRPSVAWERRLAASWTAGQPLEVNARTTLGKYFGFDFSAVRIHTDTEAASLTAAIRARAFTHSNHIYFAPGEYAPQSKDGQKVLAHELTHVVQQGGAESITPVQHGQDGPSIQRMAALNQTTPANIDRTNIAPWGPPAPRGNDYKVQTDGGSTVKAWVAYSGYPEAQRYWCHGFSLGTYAHSLYSVYSRAPMQKVIADEYTAIAPAQVQAGDIAVWTPSFEHSAVFTSVARAGGTLDETTTQMQSKNGSNPLKSASLSTILQDYATLGATYTCYRRR